MITCRVLNRLREICLYYVCFLFGCFIILPGTWFGYLVMAWYGLCKSEIERPFNRNTCVERNRRECCYYYHLYYCYYITIIITYYYYYCFYYYYLLFTFDAIGEKWYSEWVYFPIMKYAVELFDSKDRIPQVLFIFLFIFNKFFFFSFLFVVFFFSGMGLKKLHDEGIGHHVDHSYSIYIVFLLFSLLFFCVIMLFSFYFILFTFFLFDFSW
jgi:hypothetical protein